VNQFAKVIDEISGCEFTVGVGQRGISRNVDKTECRFDVRTYAHADRKMPKI
jgi:hypothetical protein